MIKSVVPLFRTGGAKAWLAAGAPIVALVLGCMALSVVLLWAFARKQDYGFATHSRELVETAFEWQVRATERVALDYAVWTDAYRHTTLSWDPSWVEANYYSNIADSIIVIQGDRTIRHAWFAEGVTDTSELTATVQTAVQSERQLGQLLSARTKVDMTASTIAVVHGRLVLASIAPISPGDEALEGARDPSRPVDYLVALDVISTTELADLAERLRIEGLRFSDSPAGAADTEQYFPVADVQGHYLGALVWIRQRPGSAAFLGDASSILLVIVLMGAAAVVLARTLVAAQVRAVADIRIAQEGNRLKSEFISTMSHELRTPLSAIIGYAGLIEEEADDLGPAASVIRDDAGRLLISAQHLTRLINDILDQSRIDAGRLNVATEPLQVALVLSDLQELVAPLAQASGNRFKVTLDANVEEVLADPLRLHQCLLNLTGNALKFTRDGQVTVTVTRAIDRRGNQICFEVSDTGIGIGKDELKGLFKPFAQANAGVAAKYGGTGLGLSISRSLARAMGGDITARSSLGQGSTFCLTLPAVSSTPVGRISVAA